MRKLIWLGCLSYFVIGMAHVVMGAVLEPMTAHYGREYADGGQLVFNQFAGYLTGVLALPRIAVRLGKRKTLLSAFALLAAAETVYSLEPPWEWMLAAAPFAGCGFGIIEAIVGAMIIDYVEERKAAAMSRVEVFFGLGALFIPAVSGVLIAYRQWNAAFLAVAALSLAGLMLWRTFPFAKLDEKTAAMRQEEPGAPANYVGKERILLVLMVFFFFIYVGLEMSDVHFLPSMQVDRLALSPSAAAFSITLFWAAMTFGRLFAGAAAEGFGYARYLIAGCLGSFAALAGLVHAGRLWSSYGSVLLLGLMMAGLFAIALVFANQLMPGKTSRTTSILIASGGIGGALIPKAAGWLMDALGTAATQWALAGLAAALTLVVAAAHLFARRRAEQ